MSDDHVAASARQISELQTLILAQFAALSGRMDGEFAAVRAEALKTRADIMERIDRLQEKVEAMREDITVKYASDDRAERLARMAVENERVLSETIRAMQRQIHRLQTDVEKLRGEAGGHSGAAH